MSINKTEQWVMLAVGKEDVRECLNYCYSDGNNLVGTNGSRLHFKSTTLPAGFYNTDLSKAEFNLSYPEWEPLWDEDKPFITTTKTKLLASKKCNGDLGACIKIDDNWYKLKYLRDALSFCAGSQQIDYHIDNKFLRLKTPNGKAIIMSIRFFERSI